MTLLGFNVEKTTDQGLSAYMLSDTKGPRYYLIRNVRPHFLFAIYAKKMGVAKVKGYSWFKEEEDGTIIPLK